MNIKLLISTCFIMFVAQSCTSQELKLEKIISKIVVTDKTRANYKPALLTITDKAFFNDFLHEINRMIRVDQDMPNVRMSNGFFEVIVHYNDNTTDSFDIIETIYDGIIIRHSVRKYKNNSLYTLFLSYYMQNAVLQQ